MKKLYNIFVMNCSGYMEAIVKCETDGDSHTRVPDGALKLPEKEARDIVSALRAAGAHAIMARSLKPKPKPTRVTEACLRLAGAGEARTGKKVWFE